MPELTIPPLLAHTPEATPPLSLRMLLLPACLAILGMLIALAAATSGQDERREMEALRVQYDIAHYQALLAQATLEQRPPETLAWLQNKIHTLQTTPIIPYARYGRQFTQWDGYRYEEIVDQGYIYHQPPVDEKEARQQRTENRMQDPSLPPTAELRWKNVVWYPLYPVLAWALSHTLNIPSTHALTAVSWTCCLLAAVTFFLYARRHFYNRMPAAETGEPALSPAGSTRLPLCPHDLAALFAVTALLLGPCSIFFYANFTESLFILLLSAFLYCLQSRWWWRAALIAAIASSCRSQGVLFGPILALTYLVRDNQRQPARKLPKAFLLGLISGAGLYCYMVYLDHKFHDPLAFMHGQAYWNVGLNWERIRYASNPVHALSQALYYAFFQGPMDWPHLWESLCVLWPPVLLLLMGGRYLSFELEIVGWMLWGLPYISNSMAGGHILETPWMSMGRFMVVLLPAYIIFGAMANRFRWLALPFLMAWSSVFALFAYQYGLGKWVG